MDKVFGINYHYNVQKAICTKNIIKFMRQHSHPCAHSSTFWTVTASQSALSGALPSAT